MPNLAPRDTVDATLAAVQGHLETGAHVIQVEGPAASGRSMIVSQLQDQGALALFLPPLLHGDAVGHGVVQARRGVELDARLEQSMADAIEEVGQRLVADNHPLVMHLPSSWSGATSAPGSADEVGLRARSISFLQTWLNIKHLQIVFVSNGVDSLVPRAVDACERLPWALASVHSLREATVWGPLSEPAARLHRAIGTVQLRPSPLELRLAVGLVKLGDRANRVARRLIDGAHTVELARELASRLADRGLEETLRRLILLRIPVPVDHLSVGWAADDFLPVLTHCLLHSSQDQRVHMSSPVRAGIRQALRRRRDRVANQARRHAALASLHGMNDGEVSPNNLGWGQTLSWLDKVHHLAHGGELTTEEWSRQMKVSVDQLVDRAKALSVEAGDCAAAANLYREVVDMEPTHHYAWHYLGYNLDRLGQDRAGTEAAYKRALMFDEASPWYNGRLVTSLIDQARYREAETAWRAALQHIDPSGDRTEREPWLARQLHRWVAEAWLRRGEVKRARGVLETLAQPALSERGFSGLLQRLEDAEEAVALADSVRPPGMPLAQRGNTVLPQRDNEERPRLRWFAGRIANVGDENVHVVFAEPTRGSELRAVFHEHIASNVWSTMSGSTPGTQASPWFELGEYGTDSESARRIVQFIHDSPPLETGDDDGLEPQRWLSGLLG